MRLCTVRHSTTCSEPFPTKWQSSGWSLSLSRELRRQWVGLIDGWSVMTPILFNFITVAGDRNRLCLTVYLPWLHLGIRQDLKAFSVNCQQRPSLWLLQSVLTVTKALAASWSIRLGCIRAVFSFLTSRGDSTTTWVLAGLGTRVSWCWAVF